MEDCFPNIYPICSLLSVCDGVSDTMYYAKYTTVSLNLPSKVTQQNPMFLLTLHVKKPTSKGEESAQARSPCKVEPRSVYLMPEQHTFSFCVLRTPSALCDQTRLRMGTRVHGNPFPQRTEPGRELLVSSTLTNIPAQGLITNVLHHCLPKGPWPRQSSLNLLIL